MSIVYTLTVDTSVMCRAWFREQTVVALRWSV